MANTFRYVSAGTLLAVAASVAACGPTGAGSSAALNHLKAHENPQERAFTDAANTALRAQFGSLIGDVHMLKGGVPAVQAALAKAEAATIAGYEHSQGSHVTVPLTPALQAKIKHDLATAMSTAVQQNGYLKTAKQLQSQDGRVVLIGKIQKTALPTINHDLGIK